MTIYTDAATIKSVTTPSGVDVQASVESASIRSVTTPSGVDVLYQDAATIGSVTTADATTDISAFVDRATIASVTTLVGSYLTETFTLHTTDYNWAAWNIAYTFDGSIPVKGCVGMFDDDHGHIVGT